MFRRIFRHGGDTPATPGQGGAPAQAPGKVPEKVPEKAIAIATGDQREIDGIDLFAKDCPVEVIITKQALQEGWDCPFAYVLCALAASKGKRAMTQLVGRILRLPQVRKQLEAMGVTVAASTSADFQKLIEAEVTKYARIAKSANITPQ